MTQYKTSSKRIYQIWRGQERSIDPMLNTQSINQNILISKQDKSLDLVFQTNITKISLVEKKNLIAENLIDLCTEPLIDNATLNKKSSDMISFYCTACGHTNRMLTEDINQILIKKNKSNIYRNRNRIKIKY